jgi:hypothetical protein
MDTILKTSEEWFNEIYPNGELKILDPDGWDRSNWDYSWGEERITEGEFNQRLFRSTIEVVAIHISGEKEKRN